MSELNAELPERFRSGSVSFKRLDKKPGTKNVWFVQQCTPGVISRKKGAPQIIEMTEEKILQVAGEHNSDAVIREMSTVGIYASSRTRTTNRLGTLALLRAAHAKAFKGHKFAPRSPRLSAA